MLDVKQATQHRRSFPVKVCGQQVCGVGRAHDLLSSLPPSPRRSQQSFVSMHLMAPLVLEHQAASASEKPWMIVVSPSSSSGQLHTARGVRTRYRPMRFSLARSARVAVPIVRLSESDFWSVDRKVSQPCCDAVVSFLFVWLQLFVVWRCIWFCSTRTCLWTRRLKSKLCHNLLSATWVGFAGHSSIGVGDASVQHDRLVVVSWSNPCFLNEFEFLDQSPFTTMSRSRFVPNCTWTAP